MCDVGDHTIVREAAADGRNPLLVDLAPSVRLEAG